MLLDHVLLLPLHSYPQFYPNTVSLADLVVLAYFLQSSVQDRHEYWQDRIRTPARGEAQGQKQYSNLEFRKLQFPTRKMEGFRVPNHEDWVGGCDVFASSLRTQLSVGIGKCI